MAIHNELGKEAESEAEKYLKASGYEILEKNWRYLKAEIDIIAKKGEELVIAEVKARSSDTIMNPEEAVTTAKKKLLIQAADYYVVSNDLDVEVRFDIISMLKQNGQWKIKHLEDAFDALL